MAWAAIVALVLALTGGGGVGLAYAADGSSPGSPLYGVDRAVESLRLALARSPEGRAELALAFAQERLTELENLIDAEGSDADIQQAIDGYGENISQAAQELAAVAATDGEARAEALAALLDQAWAVHDEVLAEIKDRVPEPAQDHVDRAIDASQAARQRVEDLFSEGMPGARPDDTPTGSPDSAAGGAPDDAGVPDDVGGPDDAGAPDDVGAPDELPNLEGRVADLEAILAQARANVENGDLEGAEAVLIEYENEVDALAQELAAVARDDIARAAALAALLDEALSIQTEILTQLLDQVPAQGRDAVEGAITSTEAGRAMIRQLFANGFPGAWPNGVSTGPPGSPP